MSEDRDSTRSRLVEKRDLECSIRAIEALIHVFKSNNAPAPEGLQESLKRLRKALKRELQWGDV